MREEVLVKLSCSFSVFGRYIGKEKKSGRAKKRQRCQTSFELMASDRMAFRAFVLVNGPVFYALLGIIRAEGS